MPAAGKAGWRGPSCIHKEGKMLLVAVSKDISRKEVLISLYNHFFNVPERINLFKLQKEKEKRCQLAISTFYLHYILFR